MIEILQRGVESLRRDFDTYEFIMSQVDFYYCPEIAIGGSRLTINVPFDEAGVFTFLWVEGICMIGCPIC